MATNSFADITNHNWQSAFQSIQSMIQKEVEQGLWANYAQPTGWCSISVSPPHGGNNSWTTHTYCHTKDSTQTASLIWPAGWPSPAENVNGDLPCHFFAGTSTISSTAGVTAVDPI